jgi:hypothetical protein
MHHRNPIIQIKALSLIDGAVSVHDASMPDFEAGQAWIAAFCDKLEVSPCFSATIKIQKQTLHW